MRLIATVSHFKASPTANVPSSVPFCSTRSQRYAFLQLPETSQDTTHYCRAPLPWLDSQIHSQSTQIKPPAPMPHHIAEQETVLLEIADWIMAFKPLLTQSMTKAGRQRVSALTLSIVATASVIALRTAFTTTETGYDIFEPEFRTIVSRSSILLQSLEQCTPNNVPTPVYAVDLAVITPLYLMVTKCRISDIRRKHCSCW
jgi:hypothetical protein